MGLVLEAVFDPDDGLVPIASNIAANFGFSLAGDALG